MKIKGETITRTVVLFIALLNQTLTMLGYNPLPFSDDEVYQACSLILTIIASINAWWKNNSFTKPAIEADKVLEELKYTMKE